MGRGHAACVGRTSLLAEGRPGPGRAMEGSSEAVQPDAHHPPPIGTVGLARSVRTGGTISGFAGCRTGGPFRSATQSDACRRPFCPLPYVSKDNPFVSRPTRSGSEHLSAGAARGQSLCGFKVTQSRQTFYLDWELDQSVQGYRKQQIIRAHPNLETSGPLYRRMYRPLADDVQVIHKLVQEHQIEFLVLDFVKLLWVSRHF